MILVESADPLTQFKPCPSWLRCVVDCKCHGVLRRRDAEEKKRKEKKGNERREMKLYHIVYVGASPPFPTMTFAVLTIAGAGCYI